MAAPAPGGGKTLNNGGSDAVLGQVNGVRNGMPGLNHRPLPPGQVTVRDNGRLTLTAGAGNYEVRPDGTLAAYRATGRDVLFRPDGRVRSLHTADLAIQRDKRGGRVVTGQGPDHSALISTGGRGGYLERVFPLRNRTFVERTYVWNGVPHPRYFRQYPYRGLRLPGYIAPVYYPTAFYGWLSNPWGRRTIYPWPWIDQQWYRFYVRYFTPQLYYSDSYMWLTDYVLSDTLQTGYEEGSTTSAATGAPAMDLLYDAALEDDDELYSDQDYPIGEELKASLAAEIRAQLDAEKAMAAGDEDPNQVDLPAWLKPDRLFIVSRSVEAAAGQRSCEMSHGDILRLTAPPLEDSTAALLKVVASKRGNCPAGLEVTVSLQDLQEMLNDLRARLDAGLDALRSGQGQTGLPAAPRAALAPARPGLPGAPAADAGVDALLAEEQRQADLAESGVLDIALPTRPPGQ